MADESQEVREETTRQLDKSVVKDWNYQVEFNKRLKENEKIQREVYAHNEKQVTIIHLLLQPLRFPCISLAKNNLFDQSFYIL